MAYKWLKTILITALCCCVWIGLAPDFYKWYITSDSTQWLRDLYTFLSGRIWINIPLCIVVLYLYILGIIRALKDEDIRPYRIGANILLLIILNSKREVVYPCITENIRFDDFFNILLWTYLVVHIVHLCNIIWSKRKEPDSKETSFNSGFSVDNMHDEILPSNVKKYGELLVDQLLSTMYKNNQSFAVGITGEWGSGKTTFLNLLRKNLDKRAEIVEFNPWMCQTPEQVTRDFFASLRHQLSQKHSSLSKPISHYAKYLEKVRISLLGGIWLESNNLTKTPSLRALKNDLSLKFKSLDKPVVILIDDLDRLESKEVFEVLRLIRNTCDINNTIYITTFDKEYVTSVLKSVGCNTPAAYLEKIFPIELHLPKPEPYQIWDVFKVELKAQDCTGQRFAEKLIQKFQGDEYNLILNILTNYRKVKRFCRLFMQNVNFIAKYYRNDFKYLDLFWIELLQFYDNTTYDNLARNPLILLYHDYFSKRYILRNGIASSIDSDKDYHNYTDEKSWQTQTPKILKKLFDKRTPTSYLSISYTENYMKYFAIGLSEQQLSVGEFRLLINDTHNYKQVIDSWCNHRKYISSIEYNFINIKPAALKEPELFNYLRGALYFGILKLSWGNADLGFLTTIMADGNFKDKKLAHDIVYRWVQEQIKESDQLLPLSRIMKSLYATKEYDSEDPNDYTIRHKILSNNEIEQLLPIITRTYLEKFRLKVNPLDILIEETDLFKLFDNCCLETECVPFDALCHYNQTCFDTIIQFFKDSDSKPTIEEYDRYRSKLFYEQEPDRNSFKDDNDYHLCIEDYSERYDHKMSSHFGSDYNKKLEEYKSKCLQTPSQVKNGSDNEPQQSKRKTKITHLSRKKIKARRK